MIKKISYLPTVTDFVFNYINCKQVVRNINFVEIMNKFQENKPEKYYKQSTSHINKILLFLVLQEIMTPFYINIYTHIYICMHINF